MSVDSISPTTVANTYVQQQQASQVREAVKVSTQSPDADVQSAATPTASDQVQLKHGTTTKNLETVRAIEQMHARLNEQAKGVRETNEGLAVAADKTDQMRSNLQLIIKNFPPFLMEDNRRQEILMSYASLKKEIEHLMIPPPPAPIYESVKRMWDSMFGENGQMQSTAVPKLDSTSSDKQVKDAAIALDKTSEQMATLSTRMTDALIQGH